VVISLQKREALFMRVKQNFFLFFCLRNVIGSIKTGRKNAAVMKTHQLAKAVEFLTNDRQCWGTAIV
jgi:hypothetical protein